MSNPKTTLEGMILLKRFQAPVLLVTLGGGTLVVQTAAADLWSI